MKNSAVTGNRSEHICVAPPLVKGPREAAPFHYGISIKRRVWGRFKRWPIESAVPKLLYGYCHGVKSIPGIGSTDSIPFFKNKEVRVIYGGAF